jgi:hypothetical protein
VRLTSGVITSVTAFSNTPQLLLISKAEGVKNMFELVPAETPNGLKISAWPNPTSSHFVVTSKSNSDKTLTILVTDVLGRRVETRTNVAANGTIQIGSQLRAGIYFVEIIQGSYKEKLSLIKR